MRQLCCGIWETIHFSHDWRQSQWETLVRPLQKSLRVHLHQQLFSLLSSSRRPLLCRTIGMETADSMWTLTHQTNYTVWGTNSSCHGAMEAPQRWKMTISSKGHTRRPRPAIRAHGQSDNLNSNRDIQPHPKNAHGFISPGWKSRMTFSALGNFTEF